MKFTKKLVRFVVALSVGLVLLAPQAQAQQGNIVLFGDSFFANPTYDQIGSHARNLTSSTILDDYQVPGHLSPTGCPQGGHTVGTALASSTGVHVDNYACSAATAVKPSPRTDFAGQVDAAIAHGALRADTRNIIINIGINDFRRNPFDTLTMNRVIEEVSPQVERMKRVSPNAKITTMSYPAISAPNGGLCPIRTVSNSGVGVNIDPLGVIMRRNEMFAGQAMYRVAQQTRVNFFDMNKATEFNNMCAPNAIRWVASPFEYALPHNLDSHLTHQGVYGVANIIRHDIVGL